MNRACKKDNICYKNNFPLPILRTRVSQFILFKMMLMIILMIMMKIMMPDACLPVATLDGLPSGPWLMVSWLPQPTTYLWRPILRGGCLFYLELDMKTFELWYDNDNIRYLISSLYHLVIWLCQMVKLSISSWFRFMWHDAGTQWNMPWHDAKTWCYMSWHDAKTNWLPLSQRLTWDTQL